LRTRRLIILDSLESVQNTSFLHLLGTVQLFRRVQHSAFTLVIEIWYGPQDINPVTAIIRDAAYTHPTPFLPSRSLAETWTGRNLVRSSQRFFSEIDRVYAKSPSFVRASRDMQSSTLRNLASSDVESAARSLPRLQADVSISMSSTATRLTSLLIKSGFSAAYAAVVAGSQGDAGAMMDKTIVVTQALDLAINGSIASVSFALRYCSNVHESMMTEEWSKSVIGSPCLPWPSPSPAWRMEDYDHSSHLLPGLHKDVITEGVIIGSLMQNPARA
jgi:hypothetical protein